MKRSTERILTTHTGSLPRPWDLVSLLEQRENGELVDQEAFDTLVRTAVERAVQQQVEADVDVVSDGEQGKIGYSTYVKDRLFGFDGESTAPSRSDWLAFPDAATRQAGSVGIRRPSCTGPISWKDREQIHTDIKNFEAALYYVQPEGYFMTAASPGVISIFLRNEYYPSREEYLSTLADVMKEEYDAICQAGYVLQVDCPDLAMGRHLHFPDLSTSEFLKVAEANVEVLNHALRDIPTDQVRLHLCWGNYEGPHHRDIPLKDIIQVVLNGHEIGRKSTRDSRVADLFRNPLIERDGRHPSERQLGLSNIHQWFFGKDNEMASEI